MKHMMWLSAFLCLSLTAQTSINPNHLIDRADLTQPKQYILNIHEQARENLNHFRVNKNKDMTGVTWSETTFSFKAKHYPELVNVPTLIDSLMTVYRAHENNRASEAGRKEGYDKNLSQERKFINKVAVDLFERGLSTAELKFFRGMALAKKENTYGLHIQVSDLFQKQAKENGINLSQLKELDSKGIHEDRALESYYEFFFQQYHLTQAEVYGYFLENFSLRSRKALLSYAYEKGLEWTDLHHTMKEPSTENWKETMLFLSSEKGGQQ